MRSPLISSQTVSTAARAALALAAAAAAGLPAGGRGEEGPLGIDGGSCVTTVTASTTFGVSLMQATSARGRLGSAQVGDAGAVPEAPPSSGGALRELDASVQGGGYREEGHLRRSFRAAFAAASSLVQEGQALGRSAFDQLAAAPGTLRSSLGSMAAASTGVLLIFTITFLLIVGGFAYVLIFHPSMFGLQGPPQEPPREADLLARARVQDGPRAFYPMTASPQLSSRGNQLSPEMSAKRLPASGPEGAVGTSQFKLAQVRGDKSAHESSDDEVLAVGASAFTPGGRNHLEFCPDLVVPQHCECILVLPLDIGNVRSSFDITDVNGSPVLRATPQQASAGRPWKATVSTATGDTLVQCCETRPHGAAARETEFHLLRASGAYFAKLTYDVDGDRYLLTLQNNIIIRFWGNFENNAVNITDDANRLLATTEVGPTDFDRTGKYCKLRVAPLADVGMALCGILCIAQHKLHQRGSIPHP